MICSQSKRSLPASALPRALLIRLSATFRIDSKSMAHIKTHLKTPA